MRHGTSPTARALLALGGAVALAPLAAATSHAGVQQAGAIKVVGNAANKFDPVDVKATPNAKGEISVTLTSEGAPHTWENKALGIDTGIVMAGQSKTITFKAPPAGQHKVVCSLHESQGMVGTLTVEGGAAATEDPEPSESAEPSEQPPASGSASASVGAPAGGDNAPTAGADDHGEEGEEEHHAPGLEDNEVLERIEAERAAQEGAVSGFKFFTMVCIAFLAILGAAVMFSTRPRRAGR
ncbi:MAG TPA: cupredoxin domain-containing protein [Frankiaceae bacterium]|nr:cupredoxin domain-containing protein [Frankiaceae bacterium]